MVLIYKRLQTIIAIKTGNKVIELFCIADNLYKFFDTIMSKYTLKHVMKR